MFSPDNFYTFFDSYYGWKRTKIMPWQFVPHGSKDLYTTQLYHPSDLEAIVQQHGRVYQLTGALILHDQEPFSFESSMHTYRKKLSAGQKNTDALDLSDQDLFLVRWRSCSWPIFCHSERDSVDIDRLSGMGVIPCHYFWHGLIARDWYRHWKHHGDLLREPTDYAQRFLLYCRDTTGSRQYRISVLENLRSIDHEVLHHHWQTHHQCSSDASALIDVRDAQQSAIHLVAETVFREHKSHLTEKSLRPMVMRQPFIVFGGAGSLRYLRSYGFRTFDHVWDESYDDEPDPDRRLHMVLDLVHSLARLGKHDFDQILLACQDSVCHNHSHFFSERFEQIMLHEYHSNMQASITQQTDLMRTDPGGSLMSVYDRHLQRTSQPRPSMHRVLAEIRRTSAVMFGDRYQAIRKQYPWLENF